jgi:excisionase family DNA binding protein
MNPDDYLSAAETARVLGVSRQRVSAMITEGDLPAVYPWPRAVRIPRSAVEAWKAGDRPEPVHRTAARHYVLYEGDVMSIDSLSEEEINALCRKFIRERRPNLRPVDIEAWSKSMTATLIAHRP